MKILFDSVLYTFEGITGHAREEAKFLNNAKHQLFVTDENYRDVFESEFLDMYQNFHRGGDFVTYCVQPPVRPHMMNKSLMAHQDKKKLVYFLAFEGDLPPKWVEIINEMPIKLMLVPSKYNKRTFEDNGVKHTIKVLPHGVNQELYKPTKVYLMDEDDFIFLWVGTPHNRRKGLKEMAEAWMEFSKKNKSDKIHLMLKMNTVYGCSDENKEIIEKLKDMGNVMFIEQTVPEESMAALFHGAHAYISTSLNEGFGMNILQAMACGTPVLTTRWSGNNEFCTADNVISIPADKKLTSINQIYGEQQYKKADYKKLAKLMEDVMVKHKEHKKLAMSVSKDIREDYSWKKVGKKLESFLTQVDKGKI